MNRRVLMLTAAWPPVGRVGARRPLRLARRLPARGWDPIILTPNPDAVFRRPPPHDDTLTVPPVEVHRVGRFIPSTRLHHALGRLPAARLTRRVLADLLLPDQHPEWLPAAARAARRIHRERPIDLVWATGGPFGVFVVAAALAALLDRPLVLDYRDPWTTAAPPRRSPLAPPPALLRALEARLLARAAGVAAVYEDILTANRAAFGQPQGRPWRLIPNGFDPLDLADDPLTLVGDPLDLLTLVGDPLTLAGDPLTLADDPLDPAGDPLTLAGDPLDLADDPLDLAGDPLTLAGDPLTLTGDPLDLAGDPLDLADDPLDLASEPLTLAGDPLDLARDPLTLAGHPLNLAREPLTLARPTLLYAGACYGPRSMRPVLEALHTLGPGDRGLHLQIFGELDPAARAHLEAHPLPGRVDVAPRLPARALAGWLKGAAALLLLVGDSHDGAVTGKVFDYLAAGRPILGHGPPDCAAAALIARCGVGEWTTTHAELTAALRRVEAGATPYAPVEAEIARYSADAMADATAALLDDVHAAHGRTR